MDEVRINTEWLRCLEKETEDNIAYINFLQTNDFILLPKLNKKSEDEEAFRMISKYYEKYAYMNRIFQVDVTDVAKYGGALNCVYWTIKK